LPFGLIETLRSVDGSAPLLKLHQERLARSWPAFFAGRPPSLAQLAGKAIEESTRVVGQSVLVRVEFTGAPGGKPEASIEARPLRKPPKDVTLAIATRPRREPPEQRLHKSSDRAWADELAVSGAFETLFWDEEHGLLEGTRTNLFVLRDRTLSTPPIECGLVPGVVRARLLQVAASLELDVEERPLSPADLKRARGLFLTGSGVGIVAVTECDGRKVGTREAALLARGLMQFALAPR